MTFLQISHNTNDSHSRCAQVGLNGDFYTQYNKVHFCNKLNQPWRFLSQQNITTINTWIKFRLVCLRKRKLQSLFSFTKPT